jgi:hypothetical protein
MLVAKLTFDEFKASIGGVWREAKGILERVNL